MVKLLNKAVDWLVVQYIYDQGFRCLVNGLGLLAGLGLLIALALVFKVLAFVLFITLLVFLIGAVAVLLGYIVFEG